VTVETLPDDVLLVIFTFYLLPFGGIDVWRTLVHVCQRWRYLVFASPVHLDLRLECTIKPRAREMLGVWPAFPIVITDESDTVSGVDNIIAALERRDRVCQIGLDGIPSRKMDTFVPAMLGPFPALEEIIFGTDNLDDMAVVPDSFLGGSAPQLELLVFHAIPFPALPTLLSSTRNLVHLHLAGIPRSGYISPEAMVTCLSAMPRLDLLHFEFDSPESFPNRESRRHPPLTRSTLPALRELSFEGVDEYFEDLVARIDTPGIRKLEVLFFHRHFYNFSPLSQFIGRVEVFKSPGHANIKLSNDTAEASASLRTGTYGPARLLLGISCDELYLKLRYLVQLCSSSLLPFSNVENLAISSAYPLQKSLWGPTAEDFLWLDLLHSFSAVRGLDIDENSLTPVAYALIEVVEERITEMFPDIRRLSIGEHLPSRSIVGALEKFAAARGLFTRLDHPHRWLAD
jgi:hypothetical protein